VLRSIPLINIFRLMAMALDLPPDWFAERYKKPLLNLRPLHYSAALSRPDEVRAAHDAAVKRRTVCGGFPSLRC